MKQETYAKAKHIDHQIIKAKHIIGNLKKEEVFIGYYFHGAPDVTHIPEELQKRILPICEEYLKELEKEFEEL